MAPRGTPRRVTSLNKTAKKKLILEKLAEGRTITDACNEAAVSTRVVLNWRQQDERFAVAFAAAQDSRRDVLVGKCWEYAMDKDNTYRHLMLMFLTKQADPSFRDNHKVEHVVSGGLAASLKQLAKLGRSE